MNLGTLGENILKGDLRAIFGMKEQQSYIHPSEAARLLHSLPMDAALQVYQLLPDKSRSAAFAYLDSDTQLRFVRAFDAKERAFVLNAMPSDDRQIFFSKLQGMELSAMLEVLDEEKRRQTTVFLGYPKKSIAHLINTDAATVLASMTVAEACEHLREHHKDSEAANVIYVVDEQRHLIDDIPVRRFVMNDPSRKISDILDGFYVSLKPGDWREKAIDTFREYDRVVLPVVDDSNVLLGVVTVDDVLDLAEQQSTAEIQKFGGVESLDYPYVATPFVSLIRKRAGWLIILFFSEMLTATAMGYFDSEISKAVVLALFVPLIISSGGNSGSQAATLIIRAMAVKELSLRDWWFVMRREILSGLTLGVILGAIGFLRIILWQHLHWYDYSEHYLLVAKTIFFSLIGIVMWGTLSGSMIPMFLKRLGLDPAASSAPFVATLVDVTGLVIYFSIAALFLRGTLL